MHPKFSEKNCYKIGYCTSYFIVSSLRKFIQRTCSINDIVVFLFIFTITVNRCIYCCIQIWERYTYTGFCSQPRYWLAGRQRAYYINNSSYEMSILSTYFYSQFLSVRYREQAFFWMVYSVQEVDLQYQCNTPKPPQETKNVNYVY